MKNKHKGHPAVQWERGDWMYPINEPPPKKNNRKKGWPDCYEKAYYNRHPTPTQHINQPKAQWLKDWKGFDNFRMGIGEDEQ